MEEKSKLTTLDELGLLLKEVNEALKKNKTSSDLEPEVYAHLQNKITRNTDRGEDVIHRDYHNWELERTIFYALTHFLAHIPFAKEQPLWRKILLCSEKAFPFDVISKALSRIKKNNGIMYKIPSVKMANALSRLKLSHVDLPLGFVQSLSQFRMLRTLKLRNITIDGKLLCNVVDTLGWSLPENLESLDLSRNLLGVNCVTDDQSETAKKLKIFFSRVWLLKKLAILNLSNNLINNSFFITFCLYRGEEQDRPKNKTLKVLKLCANTLSNHSSPSKEECLNNRTLTEFFDEKDRPENIFPPFVKKFECAKLDIAFNFIMHVEKDITESEKPVADVLVRHAAIPFVESALLPEYVLNPDKPLAVIAQRKNHVFILIEQLYGEYAQLRLLQIDPRNNTETREIGAKNFTGIWTLAPRIREYLIELHKNNSFSHEVVRDNDDIETMLRIGRLNYTFAKCPSANEESCYTYGVKLFNSTKTIQNTMKRKIGLPCFNVVRGRKDSVNRYYFFKGEDVKQKTKTLPTVGDGNCFFHAVFGENGAGGLFTPHAAQMRQEWSLFLGQFESLADPRMPLVIKEHLSKVFNIFLEKPERLTGYSEVIRKSINLTKRKIEVANSKVTSIIAEILCAMEEHEHFRIAVSEKLNLDVTMLSTDEKSVRDKLFAHFESIIRLLPRYEDLSVEEFQQGFLASFHTEGFICSKELYTCYLEAIKSKEYYVFIEEVQLLSLISGVSITVNYEQDGKPHKVEFSSAHAEQGDYQVKKELWGLPREVTLVLHDNHFERQLFDAQNSLSSPKLQ